MLTQRIDTCTWQADLQALAIVAERKDEPEDDEKLSKRATDSELPENTSVSDREAALSESAASEHGRSATVGSELDGPNAVHGSVSSRTGSVTGPSPAPPSLHGGPEGPSDQGE